MANGNKKPNVRFLTQLALLSAIIILMALTPIGYIRTPFLTVTLITIPVAVGAIILGPKGGTICGLVFGLTSFYTALTAPSAMMGAFMGVNPVYVAILCIVPRVLEGFLCGLIFEIYTPELISSLRARAAEYDPPAENYAHIQRQSCFFYNNKDGTLFAEGISYFTDGECITDYVTEAVL